MLNIWVTHEHAGVIHVGEEAVRYSTPPIIGGMDIKPTSDDIDLCNEVIYERGMADRSGLDPISLIEAYENSNPLGCDTSMLSLYITEIPLYMNIEDVAVNDEAVVFSVNVAEELSN